MPPRTDIRLSPRISTAFRSCSGALASTALFSCIINLLMFTGSLFMLHIYDRVLASRNMPTLIALTVLVGVLFTFLRLFELIRSRIAARAASRVDEQLHAPLFEAVTRQAITRKTDDDAQPLRDLDMIRSFLSGPSLNTLFDLPWTPLYLGVIFLLHPHLGIFALAGTVLLAALIFVNDLLSRSLVRRSAENTAAAHRLAEECRRNASTIRAMGMQPAMGRRWEAAHADTLIGQLMAADRNGTLSALARAVRMMLQSAILALGAYLAIRQEITPGTIIAASILLSRGAAPIEQGIVHWRGFIQFRLALQRLRLVLGNLDQRHVKMSLPAQQGHVAVQALTVAAPGEGQAIVRNINFTLAPGQVLGIIGSTGAGKSTLARALVNLWPPSAGMVSMDGAPFHQWDADRLGRSIGYLSQEVELFDGAIDENIARFDENASAESVIRAARLAGVHDVILTFPLGYKTSVGESGAKLSAGQRQRIGLARALYGAPALVVMDEPNANLDSSGEAALSRAIRHLKQRGASVIIIAHRPGAIAAADLLLCLSRGRQIAFGPKDEVLRNITKGSRPEFPAMTGTGGAI